MADEGARGQSDRAGKQREFQFTRADFERIRRLLFERTGINLSDKKQELVYGRLAKRLRQLGLASFSEYFERIETGDEEELGNLINAMTTNVTSFYREPHHFEYLSDTVVPDWIKRHGDTRRLRIWSAGCSTGPEPYSIAVAVLGALPSSPAWDFKVLATDLDSNVLRTGQAGVYPAEALGAMPEAAQRRWFRRGRGESAGSVQAKPELRSRVYFRQLNLMKAWPMRGPFHAIFCRNVMIYFDKPTQEALLQRYAEYLVDGGHLFVGHSETLTGIAHEFTSLGRTMWRKRSE